MFPRKNQISRTTPGNENERILIENVTICDCNLESSPTPSELGREPCFFWNEAYVQDLCLLQATFSNGLIIGDGLTIGGLSAFCTPFSALENVFVVFRLLLIAADRCNSRQTTKTERIQKAVDRPPTANAFENDACSNEGS